MSIYFAGESDTVQARDGAALGAALYAHTDSRASQQSRGQIRSPLGK